MPKKNPLSLISKEQLEELYQDHTAKEIGQIFKCSYVTVLNYMDKHSIPRRSHEDKHIHGRTYSPEFLAQQEALKGKREDHPAWKGGTYVDTSGYRYINVNGKYRREHRVVMEKALGRELSEWEDVHHIDGNKLNNDPSNLTAITKDMHHDLHEPELEEKYG